MPDTSPPRTAQEALDRVWHHYVTEGRPPGRSATGGVKLHTENGPCAIGLFVPELVAAQAPGANYGAVSCVKLGLLPVLEMPRGPAEWTPAFEGDRPDREFWCALQNAHDECSSSGRFRERLRRRLEMVANEFGLSVPSS